MKKLLRLAVCALLLLCAQTAHAGLFDWLYEPNVKIKIPQEFYQSVDKIVRQGDQLNATLKSLPPQMRIEMQKTIDYFQMRLHESIEQGKFAALEVISTAIQETDEMMQRNIKLLGSELRSTVSMAGNEARAVISTASGEARGVIDYGSETFRRQWTEMLSTLHLNIEQELELADLIAQNRMADFYERLERYTGHTLGIADTLAQRRIEQIFTGTDAALGRLEGIVDASLGKLGVILDRSLNKLEGIGYGWIDSANSSAQARIVQLDGVLQKNIQTAGNQGDRFSENTFERLSKFSILALILFLVGFISVKTIQAKKFQLQPIKIVGIAAVLALGLFFITQDGALQSVVAADDDSKPTLDYRPQPLQPNGNVRVAKGHVE